MGFHVHMHVLALSIKGKDEYFVHGDYSDENYARSYGLVIKTVLSQHFCEKTLHKVPLPLNPPRGGGMPTSLRKMGFDEKQLK